MTNRNELIEKLLSLSPGVKRKGYWMTKDGEQIPIDKIGDSHLKNIVNFCQRQFENEAHRRRQFYQKDSLFNNCFATYENPYSMYPDERGDWEEYEAGFDVWD